MSGDVRLTLLVPGLFGPLRDPTLDAGRRAALLSGLDAGPLETLLTRARRAPAPRAAQLETLLAATFAADAGAPPATCPVAALTRQMDAGDAGADRHLRADPVHLQAGLNEVTLLAHERPAPGLGLAAEETPALLAAVNEALAEEGLQVEALATGRWYLRLPAPSGARFTSLYQVAGVSVRDALPAGEQGARWRRLLTATQTALFACPVNARREARGQAPVNSLWFFGEGALPAPPPRRFAVTWSDHELAVALALHSDSTARPLPPAAEAWLAEAGPGQHLLLLEDCLAAERAGDAGAWLAGLDALQRGWLLPLADALRRGSLASLSLVTGAGHALVLDRAALRRFWRRRRPLAALAAC